MASQKGLGRGLGALLPIQREMVSGQNRYGEVRE